jgi:hypothetical protein
LIDWSNNDFPQLDTNDNIAETPSEQNPSSDLINWTNDDFLQQDANNDVDKIAPEQNNTAQDTKDSLEETLPNSNQHQLLDEFYNESTDFQVPKDFPIQPEQLLERC